MENDYLETQQEVIALLEENGFDVLKSSIEQYAVEDPRTATLKLAIELEGDTNESGSSRFRVK